MRHGPDSERLPPLRAVVLNNRSYDDPGAFVHAFASSSIRWEMLYREDLLIGGSSDDQPPDLVVSLGSLRSPLERAGEVAAERDYLEAALQSGAAIVGVCFGAQIVAGLLGAVVRRLANPMVGWLDTGALGSTWPLPRNGLFWNEYGFDCPPSATSLGQSRGICTAFTLGRVACSQFHADVTPQLLSRWVSEASAQTEPPAVPELDVPPELFSASARGARSLVEMVTR